MPKAAAEVTTEKSTRQVWFGAIWRLRVRELFWPHPIAWGVLVAIWLVIGVVQLALRGPETAGTRIYAATSLGVPTVMELQRELLTAWNEPLKIPKAKPGAPLPPQSYIERRRETFAV